jgi:glutathione synthase/RimK-type ligase-like ATP-grasp enzyme
VQVCGPSLRHLLQLHDKANVSRFVEQTGVPFPCTVVPDGADDLDEVLSVIGPSFIVKPRWGSGTSGVVRVAGTDAVNALRALWRREKPGRRYVVQELVPGCGAGVGVLVHAGQVVACGGHKRVREVPISGGTSTARVNRPVF